MQLAKTWWATVAPGRGSVRTRLQRPHPMQCPGPTQHPHPTKLPRPRRSTTEVVHESGDGIGEQAVDSGAARWGPTPEPRMTTRTRLCVSGGALQPAYQPTPSWLPCQLSLLSSTTLYLDLLLQHSDETIATCVWKYMKHLKHTLAT
jgi:hypothetical protein